jgi:hypothetical protein
MDAEVEKRFKEFLAEYLRRECNRDVKLVTGVNEKVVSGGYCETCWYESTEVDIFYVDSKDNAKVYNFYGTMAELFVL